MTILSSIRPFARIAPAVAIAWSVALPASAAGDAAAARALFGEARQLMDAGDYARACPKLRESLRLDAGMGTRFNLGHCLERLGRTASAWALFLDVAAEARATGQQQREQVARRRARSLEERLSRLQVRVAGAPALAQLHRDGLVVGRAAWGSAIPVDPGVHEVSLSADGFEPYATRVIVAEGQKLVSLDIPPMRALPKPPEAWGGAAAAGRSGAQTAWQDDRAPGITATEIAGLTLGGLGLVSAAAGGLYQLDVNAANEQLSTMCQPPDPTQPGEFICTGGTDEFDEFNRTRNDAKTDERKVRLLFAVGGTLLLGGAVTYFWDGLFGQSSNAASLRVRPWIGQGPRGLGLSGTF